jgi:hypothetical protein
MENSRFKWQTQTYQLVMNAIGISKKKQILALDCTGGQCYFNTLKVFDREQSRICHLNTKNLLLYQGTFFHLYTSKHILYTMNESVENLN